MEDNFAQAHSNLGNALQRLKRFTEAETSYRRALELQPSFADAWNNLGTCLRELKRGGQIYFLHNDIDTIATMGQKLEALMPEARIAIAHGQMPERDLERVMRDFYQQRSNLLGQIV